MLKTKIFREEAKGLPDILNYAACIGPGIFINKDGSLSAAFKYQAADVFSATELERNIISKRMNSVFAKFGSGWAIHIDVIRKSIKEYPNVNDAFFDDPISKMIDQERREYFLSNDNLYDTLNIITLTYMPPNKAKGKFTDLMFDDDSEIKESAGEKALKYFQTKLEEFLSLSSNAFVKIQHLKPTKIDDQYHQTRYESEFLRYVNFALVGEDHPIQLPIVPMYLDQFMGAYSFNTGVIPKIDNKFIGVVAIKGFPQQSYPNILDQLSKLSLKYRWSTRFVFLDAIEAKANLDKIRKGWKQKEKGIFAQIFNPNGSEVNEDAHKMVNETKQAIGEVDGGQVLYGYYTSNIVIMDEDRETVEHNLKEIRRIIEAEGFNAHIEDINAVEAWLGTLPGHIIPNIKNTLINTFNLSHLMPLSTIWAGDKYNPSDFFPPKSSPLMYVTTNGSTPFRLNLHVSDIGHTLIFGPTGSGKSTLLSMLAAQHRRYIGSRVYAFDKGKSLYPLTKAIKGDHFDIAGDNNSLSFAPLSNIKTKKQQAWAESWISTLLELQKIQLTPKNKESLHEAMNHHIEQKSKSLTEFISNIQDETLSSALSHYSLNGSMGHLLDAEEDSLSLSNFAVFEIESLMDLPDEDAIPVLLYLFNRIETSLDGRPTMLILDEAWLMLGNVVFKNKIKVWLKVLRKANCQVILATQSLSDASNSGILDVLQESCPTKIFLPNPEAFNKGTENIFGPYDFYKQFGLNEREIEILADAVPKRDYYYFSPLGTRLFSLVLGDFSLAFVGASSKEQIKSIDSLIETEGENWVYAWLEKRGVDIKNMGNLV